MSTLRKMASFVRWRLIPVRYVTMIGGLRPSRLFDEVPPKTAVCAAVQERGFHEGPSMPADLLQQAQEIYRPRTASVVRKSVGHVFTNLFTAEDINAANPIFRWAMSPTVLDSAIDYFHGDVMLDSIQVLYSLPAENDGRESQLWHKDYGDSKSFHCVTYLNDVRTSGDGPFVFVDKIDTRRISRSPIVRRIDDKQFARELGPGKIREFFAAAGESVFVDPAVCYHFGSRCRNPRLAVFVTFNTGVPFAQPVPLIVENAGRIFDVACDVRPDLSAGFLRRMLQLS